MIENKKILYKEFIDTNSCEKLFNDNILRYLLTMNVENSLNKNIDEINKNRGEVITREELKEFEKYLMDKLKSQRKLKPDRSYQDLSSNVRKYVMQNKFEEAMGFIKNNLSENFYWMGYCYGEQSKIEEMLNSFKKCISISDKYKSEIEKSKKFYWAQTFNKGSKFFTNANKEKNSKLEMNLRDSATKAFRDCLLIYPDDVETNKNLAFVYMSAGKNEEAIEPLKKMIQLNKELDAYKYLGDIYYSLGSMNKSSYSSNDNAEGNIVAQKYFLEAVNILEEGLKFYPEDSELLKTLSASYVETGKSDVALSSFAALVNKEPDNKVYRYNHGVLLLGNDEFAMAEKEFLKAIELDPNYNNAIYNLAVTYVKWGIEINRQSEKLGKLNNEYKETWKK